MTNTATTTYRPVGTSSFERMNTPTECGCCGRSGLKVTVKMSDGNGIVWMGTGCAAKAMGVGVDIYRKAAKAADTEVRNAERAAAQIIERAETARWFAWLTETAGPGDVIEQIARLGGIAAARAAYRA